LPTQLPKRHTRWIAWFRRSRRKAGSWAVAALSIPALLVVLLSALPLPLVLPAFSIVTVSWGSLVALRLYLRPPASLASRERAEAVAGMLFLVGFGASMMTNVGDSLSALAELEKVYAAGK
jgi:pimeloyl-ACP methyl ester carboxylesterase